MRVPQLMVRLFSMAAVVLVIAAAPAGAQTSRFSRGQISIGAQGGFAFLSMSEVNDIIDIENLVGGTDFGSLKTGYDVAADLRYAVTNTYFIGLEGGLIHGETSDDESGRTFEADAVTAMLIGGGSVQSSDSDWVLRLMGGLGAVVKGTLEETPSGGKVEGAAFLFQLGGEVEYRVADAFGITGQLLVRQARVSEPDDAPYDLDFSGGAGRVGLRLYFGGGGE